MNYFSHIFWDPKREMLPVNLPLLDRPILWYGFIFALGILAAYFVVVYLLRRFLLEVTYFNRNDIVHWPELFFFLQNESESETFKIQLKKSIMQALEKEAREQCINWKVGSPIPDSLKTGIVNALNASLNDVRLSGSFSNNKRFFQGLSRFLENEEEELRNPILRRLAVENHLWPIFACLKLRTTYIIEKLTVYVISGALIGARLGDVLFYQNWDVFYRNPFSIFKIWEGGLASHGAVIGIFVSVYMLSRKFKTDFPQLSFIKILDLLVIPAALAGAFIRIGNFFNQEILGTFTNVPWAVVFGHAADGGPRLPRHPAQLYEFLFYLGSCVFLFFLWRRKPSYRRLGKISGLFFIFVFSFRFLIEFFKVEQSSWMQPSAFLDMGQYLSIPLIVLGFILFFKKSNKTGALDRIKRN